MQRYVLWLWSKIQSLGELYEKRRARPGTVSMKSTTPKKRESLKPSANPETAGNRTRPKRQRRRPRQGSGHGGKKERRPRPQINAGQQDLELITNETWQALIDANKPPVLFRHGGQIVWVERDVHKKPITQRVTQDRMTYRLAKIAKWYRETKDELTTVNPPPQVVKNVLATPNCPLPVLLAIVEVPIFGTDGSLITKPGYHSASQTLYEPTPGFRLPNLPKNPTREDLNRAKSFVLGDLFVDFPFVSAADRAHAVCLMVLPLVRNLIDGPTPLHLMEKPKSGTGAGLLIEMIAHVVTGRPIPIMTEARSDDEWRYRITSVLRQVEPFLLIGNLHQPLKSPHLAAAITSTIWEDRKIGSSETVRLPVRCAWVATANNPVLSDEIQRRTVRIRLDPGVEKSWERKDFKHSDLRKWARKNRAELVGVVLTLAQGWIVAGQPPGEQRLGSFESWTAVIGGILDIAEIPGFLENRQELYATADPVRISILALARSQDTPPLRRIPRLFALNPAHHLRR